MLRVSRTTMVQLTRTVMFIYIPVQLLKPIDWTMAKGRLITKRYQNTEWHGLTIIVLWIPAKDLVCDVTMLIKGIAWPCSWQMPVYFHTVLTCRRVPGLGLYLHVLFHDVLLMYWTVVNMYKGGFTEHWPPQWMDDEYSAMDWTYEG